MSSIPLCDDVQVYVYADDVAFFASASDIHSLQRILQSYLAILEDWLDDIRMTLNVSKSALLVFPLHIPVNVSLQYRQEIIPQHDFIKYLGVIYDQKLSWRNHIEHVTSKAARAVGMIRKLGHRRTGLRRDTLIMIYRMYVRPILEFGCVLFSGGPAYKINPSFF